MPVGSTQKAQIIVSVARKVRIRIWDKKGLTLDIIQCSLASSRVTRTSPGSLCSPGWARTSNFTVCPNSYPGRRLMSLVLCNSPHTLSVQHPSIPYACSPCRGEQWGNVERALLCVPQDETVAIPGPSMAPGSCLHGLSPVLRLYPRNSCPRIACTSYNELDARLGHRVRVRAAPAPLNW